MASVIINFRWFKFSALFLFCLDSEKNLILWLNNGIGSVVILHTWGVKILFVVFIICVLKGSYREAEK